MIMRPNTARSVGTTTKCNFFAVILAAIFFHSTHGIAAAADPPQGAAIPQNIAEIPLGEPIDALMNRFPLTVIDYRSTAPTLYEYSPDPDSGFSRIVVNVTPRSRKVYMITAQYKSNDIQFQDLAKVYLKRLGKPAAIKEKCTLPDTSWGDVCHIWRSTTTELYISRFGPVLIIADRALVRSNANEWKKAGIEDEHARQKRAADAIP